MAIQDTVKKLFGKVLKVGTPPEKEVLYKEVIKRKVPKESSETLFVNTIKQSFNNVFTTAKEKLQVSKNTDTLTIKGTSKKKPVTKKTVTKKKTTTKKTSDKKTSDKKATTKKTTTKKAPAKKTVTSKKESTEKKSVTKKPVAKKTATKKAPAKKTATKKTTETKTDVKTTATKKPVDKKSVTKKSSTKKIAVKKTAEPKADKKVPSSKKPAVKKKSTVSKKSSAPAKGTKRDEKIALYIQDIKKHYGEVDENFVAIIVKNLGPSIYRRDAELVSCSDPKELDTVRRNFLTKKLGIEASNAVLDAAIQDVCTELKGVRTKYRATFYYALAKKFKKESVLS